MRWQAFEQLEGLKLDMPKIRRLMLKYDGDGDGMISFDEFKAKATDVISSGIQYERATVRSSQRQARVVDADRLWLYCGYTVALLWLYCGSPVALLWLYCGCRRLLRPHPYDRRSWRMRGGARRWPTRRT